jgi:hypothetical protein
MKITKAQIEELRTDINNNKIWGNEKVWNFLTGYLLENSKHKDYYTQLFCGENIGLSKIWFESEPIAPRKGTYKSSEGITKLDLAFGSIKLREKTIGGIEYDPSEKNNMVCFVEGKYFSDCSNKVSYDPFRNQIIRVIENLLCFQGNMMYPEKLVFTLLTPRKFKENPKTRLYGYKLSEYKLSNNILNDINLSNIPIRQTDTWSYPANIEERIDKLKVNWVVYENILEREFNITNLDLTNSFYCSLDLLVRKLEEAVNHFSA